MFNIQFFRESPEAFYHLAKEFLDLKNYNPTPTHYFIKLLQDKGILQLNMTQNIDNLESKTGLDMEKVVQAHGANVGAACSVCRKEYDRDILDKHIVEQTIMRCTCVKENGEVCNGPVKPNIVFFGEPMNPKFFWGQERTMNRDLETLDREKAKQPKWEDGGCDLLLTIGT